MLSISRNVRLSVRVFFVCVFTFEVPFKRLFASTSQSGMSKVFKDLKFLGGKWKEVVSDLKLLLIKGVRLPQKKKLIIL